MSDNRFVVQPGEAHVALKDTRLHFLRVDRTSAMALHFTMRFERMNPICTPFLHSPLLRSPLNRGCSIFLLKCPGRFV